MQQPPRDPPDSSHGVRSQASSAGASVRKPVARVRPSRPAAASPGWLPPLPITLLLVAIVLPADFHWLVGDLRLDPPRLVLLIFMIPALIDVIGRWRAWDSLALGWVLWVILAEGVTEGADRGLKWGGAYAVEGFGSYIVARSYIRNADTFGKACRLGVVLLSLLTVPNLIECLTGKNIIRFVASGGTFKSDVDGRYGLMRAFGPYPHPILNGVMCGTAIGLAWFSPWTGGRGWFSRFVLVPSALLGAASSVSSGAVAMAMAQLTFITWEATTRWLRGRWWCVVGLFAAAYAAVGAFSNRTALHVLFYYLTFDPRTAEDREDIWRGGMQSIGMKPIFGTGLTGWWPHPTYMSSSMDAFWLVVPVQYGLPAGLCLYGCVILIALGAVRRARSDPQVRPAALAWSCTMIGIILAGATVHYWGSPFVWLSFLIGSAGWFSDAPAQPAQQRRRPAR